MPFLIHITLTACQLLLPQGQEPTPIEALTTGTHDMIERAPPEFYVKIPMRRQRGLRVLTFDFELAREMGLADIPRANTITPELQRRLLDAFGVRVVEEGQNVPPEQRLDRTMPATRYRDGSSRGDGRSVWAGMVLERDSQGAIDRIYDVTLKGAGPTPLRFSRQGDHGDGLLGMSEALQEDLVSRVLHRLGIPTTRVLATIELPDHRYTGERAVLIVRVGDHFRIAHAVAAPRDSGEFFDLSVKHDDPVKFRRIVDYLDYRLNPKAPDRPLTDFMFEVTRGFGREAARWYDVRLVHGALSLSNNSLSGQAIDFGTVGLIDRPHPDYTTRFPESDFAGQKATFLTHALMLRRLLLENLPGDHVSVREEKLKEAFERSYQEELELRTLQRLGLTPQQALQARSRAPEYASYLTQTVVEIDRAATAWAFRASEIDPRIDSFESLSNQTEGVHRFRAALYNSHAALAELPSIIAGTRSLQAEVPRVEELLDLKYAPEAAEATHRWRLAKDLLFFAEPLVQEVLPPPGPRREAALREMRARAQALREGREVLYRQVRFKAGEHLSGLLQADPSRNVQAEMEALASGRMVFDGTTFRSRTNRPVQSRGNHPLVRTGVNMAMYAPAYLLKEAANALQKRDPHAMTAAALQLKEPGFWGSLAAFTVTSGVTEAALGIGLKRGLFAGVMKAGLPLAAGMATLQLLSGRFSKEELLLSTTSFLAAGAGVHATTRWLLPALPKVLQLALTLYLAEKIERPLRWGVLDRLNALTPRAP